MSRGMTLNVSKSIKEAESLPFLGYRISKQGIAPDPTLVSKILKVITPKSKKELETFLGMTNFFGRFINNYASLALPLNDLRKDHLSGLSLF